MALLICKAGNLKKRVDRDSFACYDYDVINYNVIDARKR